MTSNVSEDSFLMLALFYLGTFCLQGKDVDKTMHGIKEWLAHFNWQIFWSVYRFILIPALLGNWKDILTKDGRFRFNIIPFVLTFVSMFFFLMVIVLLISGADILLDHSDRILPFLEKMFGLLGMRAIVSIGIIAAGFGGHLWKRLNQYSYGLGEFLFGCAVCIFITYTLTPEKSFLSQWIGLGGAAYVIARGLNNISDAKGKTLKAAAQSAR